MSYCSCTSCRLSYFFFFNDTPTTEIYTLSLHDALPISDNVVIICSIENVDPMGVHTGDSVTESPVWTDRKSTRLNSSHGSISYAVFCLKKKKKKKIKKTKINKHNINRIMQEINLYEQHK